MDSCAAASPVPEVEMSPIYRVNNFTIFILLNVKTMMSYSLDN